MSFIPFIVFIVLIITTTFVQGSLSDGASWIPAFMTPILAFFFPKNAKFSSGTIISGMASKEAILPVVCCIVAGVFSRIH